MSNPFQQFATSKKTVVVDARIPCQHCGELFKPKKKWQLFDKTECRVEYWRAKKRQEVSVFCDLTKEVEEVVMGYDDL